MSWKHITTTTGKWILGLVLVGLVVAGGIGNSIRFARAEFKPTFELAYRDDRLTALLPENYYMEIYYLHDYYVTADGFDADNLFHAEDEAEVGYTKDDLFQNVDFIKEVTSNSFAVMDARLVQKQDNIFSVERRIRLKRPNKVSVLAMQLILGGENISYDKETSTISFDYCKARLFKLENDLEVSYENNVILIKRQTDADRSIYDFTFQVEVSCYENE